MAFLRPTLPLSSHYDSLRPCKVSPRRPTPLKHISRHVSTTRACVEMPAWKQGPVDVDFAKDERLQQLEEELDVALALEQFSRAAEIRDEIRRMQSSAYVAVLSANMKFYHAFGQGSIVDMAGCWLQDGSVTCKHPLGELAMGYLDVLNAFGYLFAIGVPAIQARNVVISVRGSVAWVTCEEHSGVFDGDQVDVGDVGYLERGPVVMEATNIFAKRNGQWYVCHHTAQPVHTRGI